MRACWSHFVLRGCLLAVLSVLACPAWPQDVSEDSDSSRREGSDVMPDIRDAKSRLKYRMRNFVVVPIPLSNPTLDTGLILAGAYFWPQTPEQKEVQPASATGAAGMYTSNDSYFYGIAHNHYWGDDRWRFEGVLGHVDLKLKLRLPGNLPSDPFVDWVLNGDFLNLKLLRRIRGDWYGGFVARYLSLEQTFGIEFPAADAALAYKADTIGLGLALEYDTRDSQFSSHSGRHFELDSLINRQSLGSDEDYEWYQGAFSSYHELFPKWVLAWELKGCKVSGEAPLWDSCRVDLRGFPATEYLGSASLSGQAEARWQFHRKWGAVAFAGTGTVKDSFGREPGSETVPSYGLGLRFMVLQEHRINVRLDYARSKDNDGVYLAVGEEF